MRKAAVVVLLLVSGLCLAGPSGRGTPTTDAAPVHAVR